MTLSATTPVIAYTGNGTTTAFSVPFQFFVAGDLRVTLNGVTQTLGTNYTVSGGDGATGTVTMTVAPASGTALRIERFTSAIQGTEYGNAGAFPSQAHELGMDRVMMVAQEARNTAVETLGNDISGRVVVVTGSTVPRSLAARFGDAVNLRDHIPAGTNTAATDCTAFVQAAVDAAKVLGRFIDVPAGDYRIDGQVIAENVTFRGAAVGRRNVASYADPMGSRFLLTGTTLSPFVTTGSGGLAFVGMSFFWPGQTGVAVTPVVFPALVTGQSGQQVPDLTFDDCTITNAYDVLNLPVTTTVAGSLRFFGCRIYAIRSLIRCFTWIAETVQIANCQITPGVYQNVAVFANSANLAKWTGANGDLIYLDAGAGVAGQSIDGLHMSDSLIFGYRRVLNGVSGRFDLLQVQDNHFDAVGTVLRLAGSAAAYGAINSQYYIYQNNGPGGGFVENTTAFDINTTGLVDLKIGGIAPFCVGSIVLVQGTGPRAIDVDLWAGDWGRGSAVVGDTYAVFVSAANALVTVNGTYRTSMANGIGVYAVQAARLKVPALIVGTKNAVVIETGFAGVWDAAGLVTASTTGTQSLAVRAPGTGRAIGATLDKRVIGDGVIPAFRAAGGAQTFTGAKTQISFSAGTIDDTAAFSGGTFTAPVTGWYRAGMSVTTDGTAAAGNTWSFSIERAGAGSERFLQYLVTEANVQTANVDVVFFLAKNDTLRCFAERIIGTGNLSLAADGAANWFCASIVS